MSVLRVWTTCPDLVTAQRIGQTLVAERLVACAQLQSPVVSIYPWEDEIQETQEVPLVMKTHARVRNQLTRRLTELHPYDVPQVVWCDLDASGDYDRWVEAWVSPPVP